MLRFRGSGFRASGLGRKPQTNTTVEVSEVGVRAARQGTGQGCEALSHLV